MAEHQDTGWEACKVHWKETGDWEEALAFKNTLTDGGVGTREARRRTIEKFGGPGRQPADSPPELDDESKREIEEVYESLPDSTDAVQDLDWALRSYGREAHTGMPLDIPTAPSQVAVAMYHTLKDSPQARVKIMETYLKERTRVQEQAGDAAIEGAKTLEILHKYRDSLIAKEESSREIAELG